ncbi:MAG TPA: hypothetical protein ENI87_01775 [bacterium]|nr:hypothetical protein [bacterium]
MNVDLVIRIIDVASALMSMAPMLAAEFRDLPDDERKRRLDEALRRMRDVYKRASDDLEDALQGR